MKKPGMPGLVLLLLSLTACAPVVYDATYHDHRHSPRPVVVSNVYAQPTYLYRSSYPAVSSIAVTLYADHTYRGLTFAPLRLVIADGQYVAIPVRDKSGRAANIYAHYHRQVLHFDADKNCRTIHGSTSYRYDSKWGRGHKYANLHAGKDFDLTGLHLEIRTVANRTDHAAGSAVTPAANLGRQKPAATVSPVTVRNKAATGTATRQNSQEPDDRHKLREARAAAASGIGRMTAVPVRNAKPSQRVVTATGPKNGRLSRTEQAVQAPVPAKAPPPAVRTGDGVRKEQGRIAKQKGQAQKIGNQARNRQAHSVAVATRTEVVVAGEAQEDLSAKIRENNLPKKVKGTIKNSKRVDEKQVSAEETSEAKQKSP